MAEDVWLVGLESRGRGFYGWWVRKVVAEEFMVGGFGKSWLRILWLVGSESRG